MNLSEEEKIAKLRDAYYDPKSGLISADRLYRKLKSEGISRNEVEQFLKKQQVRQEHYQRRKPDYYPIYSVMDGCYQADLMFYPQTKRINNGYDTIMTCIEITTRKGYCIPMKGKKTDEVLEAWELLRKETENAGMSIKVLTTDLGSEWMSDAFDDAIVEGQVYHFTAQEGDHHKMGMIERFNRTMKALLSKYFTAYNTKGKWIDVLPDIISNYNNTFHRGIQCTPLEAERNRNIRKQIREAAAFKTSLLDTKKNLNVGDKVRVLKNRVLFEKEGPRWSKQVYEIEEDDITTFKLKGQDREYKHYELLKVEKIEKNPYGRVADSFDVEQNLDQARRNREGPREPVQHRPSTRFEEQTRVGLAAKKWSRGPSEAQREEITKLKRQLVDTQFVDDGIKWKIIDVKWNGKYRQIMVYYYDVDKYNDVPSLKNQEYTPIHVIRDILKENNLQENI